ncbi:MULTISPECIES: hypothetical protein [unclassified Streptomyces]|uniref:ATP synthase protein I n=1 Tax=Streptomyces johnsoniae TaxID=3075532 RepID=A0ABU2RXA2_9ACTN|nr:MULTISPECIES: hypothetical protein [unclassified Streptomyces]MDT0441340.1 hypothetical protein [Streptomyces sp. DSM 41886]ONK11177.1 hypothetical protein STBA_19060 [Streptomyces sp. MP131-18]
MQSNDARIVRGAAIPTAVAGVLATVIGAVVAGGDGAGGVALGVLVAAVFFGGGLISLGYVGRRWPDLFFGAAFLIYTTQMGFLLGLLLLLRDASFLNGRAFAAGVLAGTAVWLAGQVRAHTKVKTLYVEPDKATASTGGPS